MWDSTYDLPLSPQNNNPWFYLALAMKVISLKDGSLPAEIHERIARHMMACRIEPGLFKRWPKQSESDVTSHDELIGIASISRAQAEDIYHYLVTHDGEYNNSILPDPFGQWNLSRFFWFIAWLKARAGIKLSFYSQILWSLHVVYDLIKTKPGTDDASGRLLIWIMLSEMENYWVTGPVVSLWRAVMKKKSITPKAMLSLEPSQNPILSELAPDQF